MKPMARHILISAWLGLGSGIVCVSHAANTAPTPEARQLTEDFSPQAQNERSRREAHAAYGEAAKQCNTLGRSERANCLKNAKSQLQDDLAYAQQNYNRARQMTAYGDTKARYAGLRREAYAAFDEHRKACNTMSGAERTSCMKEARSYLEDDLAYARNQSGTGSTTGETATGGSATGGSSASGR